MKVRQFEARHILQTKKRKTERKKHKRDTSLHESIVCTWQDRSLSGIGIITGAEVEFELG